MRVFLIPSVYCMVQEWIAALESGKYVKTKGALTRLIELPDGTIEEHDCCLGVLCKLHGLERHTLKVSQTVQYSDGPSQHDKILPYALASKVGFEYCNPETHLGKSLAALNDNTEGWAAVIEALRYQSIDMFKMSAVLEESYTV